MDEATGSIAGTTVAEARTVVVIGAGTMGSGIAQTFAAAGWRVVLSDAAPEAVSAGMSRIGRAWQRDVEKGRSDQDELARRQAMLGTADDFTLAAAGAGLVIEAIVENIGVKAGLFEQLGECAPADCILASNTSSISISALAAASTHADRVVGLHFFNPAPVLPLVEIVRGEQTSDDTIARCQAIVEGLGKTPVVVHDAPGFVGNRILLPMINEAVACLEDGVADAGAIDAVMQLGMNHPIGPLALADLIGLDVCVQILEVLHHDLGDDKYRPAALLRSMVDQGRLGRKSGHGFFDYS